MPRASAEAWLRTKAGTAGRRKSIVSVERLVLRMRCPSQDMKRKESKSRQATSTNLTRTRAPCGGNRVIDARRPGRPGRTGAQANTATKRQGRPNEKPWLRGSCNRRLQASQPAGPMPPRGGRADSYRTRMGNTAPRTTGEPCRIQAPTERMLPRGICLRR